MARRARWRSDRWSSIIVACAAAALCRCALFPSLEGLSSGGHGEQGSSDAAPDGTSTALDAGRSPTFRGASSNPGGTLAELSLLRPTGSEAGDLLVASIVYRGSMEITPPPGWTLVLDTPRDGGHLASFVTTAATAEAATYVFHVPVAYGLAGGVTAWGDAVAVEASAGATGDGKTVELPAVTALGGGRQLLAVYAQVGAVTYLPPPGLTEHFDVRTPSGTYVASVSQASARRIGPQPDGPLAATASGAGGGWMAQTLLIR